MTSTMQKTACGLVLAMVVGMAASEAHAGYRQYYSSWSYYRARLSTAVTG